MDNFNLNLEQKVALDAIGKYTSLFISGAAGCGKSVVISKKIKNDTSGTYLLCATTNQASRILTEKINIGEKVPTLQSVLGMKPVYDGSTKNVNNLLDFEFSSIASNFTALIGINLIVDEASMICKKTQDYIFELLELNLLKTVTFVGDKYQLPCVKNEPFDYSLVDKVIELTEVKRAQGELLNHYNKIREDVIANKPITIPDNVTHFDNIDKFTNYINSIKGSKCVISWTNTAANIFSKLLDNSELYVNQECTALSNCNYRHLEKNEFVKFSTNSNIIILQLFKNYAQMERTAIREEYMYELPREPIGFNVDTIRYAKILNEDGDVIYISIWQLSVKEKDILYLNKMTREYRKFLDLVKKYVPNFIWNKYSKEDGYPKSLTNIKKSVQLHYKLIKQDNQFWHNFYSISEAIPLRSVLSTTAHRVQGTTIDVAGVNWTEISKQDDLKLQYVALTRAAKELVLYTGVEYETL